MDSQQSPCVVPSNAPAPQVSKSTSRIRQRASFTGSTQNSVAGNGLQIQERRRQRQKAIPANTELRSERYIAYRRKQRGGDKKAQREQKWDDDVEEAFQLAVRMVPNTGRTLTPCSVPICGRNATKLCGRNEHIEHFIKCRTGVGRTRKQISSHIQVLREMQKNNCEWLALVTKPNKNQPGVQYPRRDVELPAGDEHHPVVNQMPHGIIGSNGPYSRHSVCRIKFEMYIKDPEGLKTLHTYSSLQSEIGSASRALDDVKNWRMTYPPLALYHERGELDGKLILFDTTFSLLDNHPPYKSNLMIDFNIDIARGVEYTDWECHTNFYENGILEESVSNPTNSNHLLGTNDATIEVPLHSSWWVKRFFKITTEKLLQEQRGDPHAIQQEAERVRRHIQDISVVQEIWATPQANGSASKRMAIFLWNFNQTRNNEAPTTTWRKLMPPPPPIEPPHFPTQAATPCFIEPSLAIDTNLRHQDLLQPKPLHGHYFNSQSSLFAEDPETLFAGPDSRLVSLPSTPVADYGSFPSSTSTSFPSSISNGTLPLELSRDSTYGSQDSIFHPQDAAYTSQDFTLESQDLIYRAHYPSEDSVARSQDSAYHAGSHNENQDHHRDHYYCSQVLSHQSHLVEHLEYSFNSGSVLQHQPDENYYPSPDQTGLNTKATDEDFASVNIQLSYSEAEDIHPSYVAPYVAPMVNMLSHQAHHDNDQDHCSASFHHDHVRTPQTQDPFDMDQWRAVDQAVQWANTKFQSGDYEEVRDMMKHGQESEDIGEISEMERGVDVEMGLVESYGEGQDGELK